jgi:ectoine hydroxylase-related dioxygenase (phytanoyl-CoA dioxygenase family)
MIDRFSGRWATADMQAGDIVVFGMHLMHMSLVNTTDRLRLSCDTRWQPKDEPADERWVGEEPKGHYAWDDPARNKTMAQARREWGV